jgi:hypothetical protein
MKMKHFFIVAFIAALLPACSQISPPSIYSSKALDELIFDLKKISEDFKIERIIVFEKEKLSSYFGMVVVNLRNSSDVKYEQTFYYNFDISHDDSKPEKKFGMSSKPNHYINVEDIDKLKDTLEKYVEEAKTQIPEGYTFGSVSFLTFEPNSRGEIEISFEIQVTETGKSIRKESGRTVTDCYELTFKVDKDGNITHGEW